MPASKPKRERFFAIYCTVDDLLSSNMFQPVLQRIASECSEDEESRRLGAIWSARAMFASQITSIAERILPTVKAGAVFAEDEKGYVALVLADRRYSAKTAAKYPDWQTRRVPPDESVIKDIQAVMPIEALRTCEPRWFSEGSTIGGPYF